MSDNVQNAPVLPTINVNPYSLIPHVWHDLVDMLCERRPWPMVIVMWSGRACVNEDTEYFNGHEWKKIKNYQYGDRVLTYYSNGMAKLTHPSNFVVNNCPSMLHFQSKTLDFVCTNDHRLIYKTEDTKILKEDRAENIIKKKRFRGNFISSFNYSGSGINLTDDEIRLMVAVHADGYFNKNRKNNQCRINLKKPHKQKALEALLNKCHKTWTTHKMSNGFIGYYFESPIKSKHYDKRWYTCSNQQLQIIADECLKWDGNFYSCTRKDTSRFYTTNKQDADFIQFTFASCGYRTRIFTTSHTIKNKKIECINVERFNTRYGMLSRDKQFYSIVKTDKSYCFTVESGMWVSRYNGRILITGNCVKSTTNAEIMILEGIMKGNRDFLVWTYEEKAVSVTIARNLEEAINYLNLDSTMFKFNVPINARKWVDISFQGKSSRIWFIHASGQKSLNCKGMEPLKNHVWEAQLFYEADQFVGWDTAEIANATMTLTRGKNVSPTFRTIIECNEPRPGSGGMWLHDFLDTKQKEHELMQELARKHPDNTDYQRPVLWWKKTNMFEFWQDEYKKFTSPQQRANNIGMYLSDRDSFDWVVMGKPIAANGAVFKHLREEKHFGTHENFQPDYLGIGCVDKDTEFFNGQVWKKISDWDNDRVLQWNEDGTTELVVPQQFLKLPCIALNHFKQQSIDLKCCDSHLIPVYHVDHGKKIFQLKKPNEICKEDAVLTSFKAFGQGLDLSDDEIRLHVMVFADGHFRKDRPLSKICLCSFKKTRKIKRCEQLLTKLSIPYLKKVQKRGETLFRFKMPTRQKNYQPYWYNASQSQLKIIFEECLLWDGDQVRKYSSKIKSDAEFIQYVAHTQNHCGNICEYKLNHKIYYEVNFSDKIYKYLLPHIGGAKVSKKYQTLDGYKYCFITNSGYFVIRSNNQIHITHNCDLGRVDATACVLSGVQYPIQRRGTKFAYQMAMEAAWHSNRWHKWMMPSESGVRWPLYQWMDMVTAINQVVIPFIDFCAKKYQGKIIYVNIEYTDPESYKYISGVARVFAHNPMIRVNLTWGKEKNSVVTGAFSSMINIPNVFKCANRYVWNAITGLTYEDNAEKPDEELKIKDSTKLKECEYFDLWDAAKYTGDRGKFSELNQMITNAIFSNNPDLINQKNIKNML